MHTSRYARNNTRCGIKRSERQKNTFQQIGNFLHLLSTLHVIQFHHEWNWFLVKDNNNKFPQFFFYPPATNNLWNWSKCYAIFLILFPQNFSFCCCSCFFYYQLLNLCNFSRILNLSFLSLSFGRVTWWVALTAKIN